MVTPDWILSAFCQNVHQNNQIESAMNQAKKNYLYKSGESGWRGEPVLIIHRAACRYGPGSPSSPSTTTVERDASLLLAEAQQQRTHQEGLQVRWRRRRLAKWSTRKAVGVEQVEMGVAATGYAETSAVGTSVRTSMDSSSRRNFLHFDSP